MAQAPSVVKVDCNDPLNLRLLLMASPNSCAIFVQLRLLIVLLGSISKA